MITQFEPLNRIIGTQTLTQHIFGAIENLFKDKQWRNRLSVVEKIPNITETCVFFLFDFIQDVDFVNKNIIPLYLECLMDTVFAVREGAAKNLAKIVKIFGNEWANKNALQSVIKLKDNQNYLHRMTTLFTFNDLTPVVNEEVCKDVFLPIVLDMAKVCLVA